MNRREVGTLGFHWFTDDGRETPYRATPVDRLIRFCLLYLLLYYIFFPMKWLKCSYVVLALCPCRDQGKAGCFGTDCPSNIPVFPYFLFCDMCLQSFAVSVASIGRSRYCRRRPATIREVYLSCIRPFMWVIAGRHAPPPQENRATTLLFHVHQCLRCLSSAWWLKKAADLRNFQAIQAALF